ncbi:membrane protein [Thermodesulfomicrobium sp. WS]|uniref:queuosine precursor transporter n=1 Tax=Thermodesulfomicrobium sp. WS TaxID=3004129 RepID=UPI0024912309|nr:queuosine precursor transporter [Thermodesulfomicrobium sp. WS]BDV01113.1 membrane protein [Thermodesulfomicrobium sp. WS]
MIGFNELLWFSFALVDLSILLLIYRFFGKIGLYVSIVISIIICNIEVLKTVTLFGLTTTLGNVLYASIFLATDILSEMHGKEDARRGVILGFVALVLSTLYLQVALLFIPDGSDFAQPHLEALFGLLPRVALASMTAYLVSQMYDVWAFHAIREKTGVRHLWLRNNGSTLVSQFLDSLVFCVIAFAGVYPMSVFGEILLTTYGIKALVAVLDTPFMYLARRIGANQAALA